MAEYDNPVQPHEPAPLPLANKRIVVSRSQQQASSLSDQLRALGAEPVEVAMIAFDDPTDGGAAANAAVARLGDFSWVVLTSPNGARSFAALLEAASIPSTTCLACVGPGTARVLEQAGLRVDLVPDRSIAEGLLECFPRPTAPGQRVLIAQAEVSRDVLDVGLSNLGWAVERVATYRTVDAEVDGDDRTAAAEADAITFMSSSAVERFVRMIGVDSIPPVVACIGPITADTARSVGLDVAIEADVHTLDGLLDSLVDWAANDAG